MKEKEKRREKREKAATILMISCRKDKKSQGKEKEISLCRLAFFMNHN